MTGRSVVVRPHVRRLSVVPRPQPDVPDLDRVIVSQLYRDLGDVLDRLGLEYEAAMQHDRRCPVCGRTMDDCSTADDGRLG